MSKDNAPQDFLTSAGAEEYYEKLSRIATGCTNTGHLSKRSISGEFRRSSRKVRRRQSRGASGSTHEGASRAVSHNQLFVHLHGRFAELCMCDRAFRTLSQLPFRALRQRRMMRAAARSWKTIALRSALSFWKRCAQGAAESADEVSEGEAATMKADTVVNNIESNEKVKTTGWSPSHHQCHLKALIRNRATKAHQGGRDCPSQGAGGQTGR
jgi:hypothetical protein